jgi:hypothetical protein
MNLENRLRAELERSGRSTKVGVAPSIDRLSAVADGRRHRNRVVGAAGAFGVTAVLLLGAFAATQPDDTVVVADGGRDAVEDPIDSSASAVTNEAPPTEAVATAPAVSGGDDSELVQSVDVAPTDEEGVDQTAADQETNGGELLQAVPEATAGVMTVSTRASAVDFAGGSGVFVLADGASGYRGLASKFGADGAQAIGLSSVNGLDWVEAELEGVTAGATASALREYEGRYVALFDRFDSESLTRQVFVGVSTDLLSWDLSDALPGQEVFATDIAVGAAGVLVLGDDSAPNVWTGPIGGPYVLTAQIDAASLAGATTLDDQFLVAGRSPGLGISLFSSTDGIVWGTRQLSSPDVAGADQRVSVADGTIVLTNTTEEGQLTLISSDGGLTWEQLTAEVVEAISVSQSTLGFLGSSGSATTITLSDGAVTTTADLDVAAPDRLSLLATNGGQALMLASSDGGGLTWIVASR